MPCLIDGRFKIFSFRSKDPVFKTDPGVIPPEKIQKKSGITIIQTNFHHNDMRDDGADEAKASIAGKLDELLDDESPLKPIVTSVPLEMTYPGPVAPYVPVVPQPEMSKRVGSALSATVTAQK